MYGKKRSISSFKRKVRIGSSNDDLDSDDMHDYVMDIRLGHWMEPIQQRDG